MYVKSNEFLRLLTQTKGLRRIRTNHHSRNRHTPPSPFRMLLSISDAGLFLPSPSCNASCWPFRQYKSSLSSTYVANGTHLIVQYERLDAYAIASADSSDCSSAYGRWNVPATSISVGNGSASLEGYTASLDSDFPLITLPEDIVMLLENELGLKRPNRWMPSSMDCLKRDESEDLIIRLGGYDFMISAYEYTIELDRPEYGGHRCLSAFHPMSCFSREKYTHLGSAFLRGFYMDERTVSCK
jgi:Eukaryotic aspartyl protease